jgi:hypothetical protein
MVQVVKSEWHQVEKRYSLEIDEVILSEIYPDDSEDEIAQKMQELIEGELDIETVISDGQDQGYYLDWDWMDEDDWWTDRKGGYEVTYEVQDE